MDTLSRSDALARLSAARTACVALRPPLVAGAPWPLAAEIGTGPEASWGPREVLAHLAEMLAYWYGQHGIIAQAGRASGEGIPFGRGSDDALRVQVIDRDRRFPIGDLLDLVDEGIARWVRRTETTTDRQGAAAGLTPGGAEMTADALRDRMIVAHLEEHLAQLRAALAAGQPGAAQAGRAAPAPGAAG